MEIHEQTQVPLDKIVITKPAGPGDAAGGFIAPAPLAKCLKAVKALGWDAGVTFWQYPRGNARLLKGVTRGTWNTGTQCEVKSEL
jgi:chitinase